MLMRRVFYLWPLSEIYIFCTSCSKLRFSRSMIIYMYTLISATNSVIYISYSKLTITHLNIYFAVFTARALCKYAIMCMTRWSRGEVGYFDFNLDI